MGAVAHDLPYRMCLPAICGVGRGGSSGLPFIDVAENFSSGGRVKLVSSVVLY